MREEEAHRTGSDDEDVDVIGTAVEVVHSCLEILFRPGVSRFEASGEYL